jgi:transposase
MASRTTHRKANGKAYVYSVVSYWDKEKKSPRNRQTCLGRLDEKTGEIIPVKRRPRTPGIDAAATLKSEEHTDRSATVLTRVVGPCTLLMKVANDTGLTQAIKKCFPETHESILSLVFYIAHKGNALSRCETWSNTHTHPSNKRIISQRISDLLHQISEDSRQRFLSQWVTRLSETEMLCYDLTSVSSYATANEFVRWGYNRDHESLPQINLAMLYGQKSGLPAYYRRLPGNVPDTKTLQTTMTALGFLGQTRLSVVLDRGFYSEKNVDALLSKKYGFVMAVPTGRLWVRNIIDQYYNDVTSPEKYRQVGENEVLYMVSHVHRWKNRRCYLHLYYNATRAAEDYDNLIGKLITCKEELKNKNLNEKHRDLYDRYFVVRTSRQGAVSVAFNEDEIKNFRNRYAGFFCIFTNRKTDSAELLDVYRRRDVVENCFDDLKNALDMKRLRIHSSTAMDTRLFLQFLALILLSRIRKISRDHKSLKYMTAREIIEVMETIMQSSCLATGRKMITEIGPIQKSVIEAFGL